MRAWVCLPGGAANMSDFLNKLITELEGSKVRFTDAFYRRAEKARCHTKRTSDSESTVSSRTSRVSGSRTGIQLVSNPSESVVEKGTGTIGVPGRLYRDV
jgi:hypothetical protein